MVAPVDPRLMVPLLSMVPLIGRVAPFPTVIVPELAIVGETLNWKFAIVSEDIDTPSSRMTGRFRGRSARPRRSG